MQQRTLRPKLTAMGAFGAAIIWTCSDRGLDDRAIAQRPNTAIHAARDLKIETDLDAPILSGTQIQAIRAETEGRGFLILKDGDVLRGRVLAEGVLMLPGARVYYEGDTHLVSCGEVNVFLGTFVPITPVPAPLKVTVSEGGIATGCTHTQTVDGAPGATPGDLSTTIVGDKIIDAGTYFASIDGGNATALDVAGDSLNGPTIIATGGDGGNGANIKISVTGKLTINGTGANARGGNGAFTQATGLPGIACGECGGQAFAKAGNGGNAGSLVIECATLEWNPPLGTQACLQIKPGGLGGKAVALGGNGGNCQFTCGDGGDGGDVEATGGNGGDSNVVTIRVAGAMTPAPADFVRKCVGVEIGATGGAAIANGGHGGGGGLCPCPDDGGDGGDAGSATTTGGNGGSGIGASGDVLLTAPGPLRLRLGASDGGTGGECRSHGGIGGPGASALKCPCDEDFAGDGGWGGMGGNATATGGKGGPAGNVLPLIVHSGSGGHAIATCNLGGLPGNGGDCVGPEPPVCTPGDGGTGGIPGDASSVGGEPGDVLLGAKSGAHGSPTSPTAETCNQLLDGLNGNDFCTGVPPCGDPASGDCCLPHDTPGCANPACCASVCEIAPFCCADSWDGLCASLASLVCPDCAPASN